MKKLMRILAVTVILVGLSTGAQAITLTDNNSSADIDPFTQSGMFNWLVDGTDMMYQQWFWYRIGNNPEQSIDTISAPVIFNPAPYFLKTTYGNGSLQVEVTYLLTGGAANSNTSDIAEVIKISNLGRDAMDFHFFQYSDFDLGNVGNDTVEIVNANTAKQWDPAYAMTETADAPAASRYEANFFATTRNALNDNFATDLNNVAGPFTGDATWAFQWDVNLAPGGTFIISKDKHISPIPEPVSMLLLGVGLVGVGLMRKKLA